jgi:hypothetical protein
MKPQPTLSLDEFRAKSNQLHQKRSEARRDYERYAEAEAKADKDYRVTLATAFAQAKAKEMTAAQADIEAHSMASDKKLERDLAKSMAKSALLRIEQLEADRATLRSIAEWSQRIEGVTA